jgi:hypothetical protein
MAGVLVCGALGFVSPLLPDTSLVRGDDWLVDTWALTGILAALCAAAAVVVSKSTYATVAVFAGVGVATGAAMFASPDVQGPGFDLLAWISGLVMIYAAVAYLRRLRS